MSSVFRYIRKAPRIAAAFVAEPMETWIRFHAKFANFGSSRRPRCSYVVDPDWDRRLHEMLGAPWPCREAAEFWTLWPEVIEALTAQGMRIGPASFGVWNDGEPELVRAVWCLTRHLRPTKVVETGVARGLTSRFILEALEKNKAGHLWSVDLPPLLEPQLHAQIGAAVGNRFAKCRSLKSLLLGYYERAGTLVFVGRAGTEFSQKPGHKLVLRLKKIERSKLLFAELPREYRRGSGLSASDPNEFAIGSFPA